MHCILRHIVSCVGMFLLCSTMACDKVFVLSQCICSLEVIRKCVRCVNGHPFCVECAGQCGLKQLQEILMIARDEVDNFGFHDDDFLQTVDSWVWRLKQDRKLPDRYRMIRVSMFFDDDQRPRSARTAVTLPRIRCECISLHQ